MTANPSPSPPLAARTCVPCSGDTPPMLPVDVVDMLLYLDGWDHEDYKKLKRTFRFQDFATALAFVNRIGAVAEEQDHHPDLCLSWGRVDVTLWTHAIDALSENDFILAAKIDELYRTAPGRK